MQIRFFDPHRGRAQQIALDAQHIPVAAGVMQKMAVDSRFALHQQGERLIAHARRSSRTIRNIDRIHSYRFFRKREPSNSLRTSVPFGRDHLHHRDKFSASELRSQNRPLF